MTGKGGQRAAAGVGRDHPQPPTPDAPGACPLSVSPRGRPLRNSAGGLQQGRAAPASPRPHPNPLPAGEGARPRAASLSQGQRAAFFPSTVFKGLQREREQDHPQPPTPDAPVARALSQSLPEGERVRGALPHGFAEGLPLRTFPRCVGSGRPQGPPLRGREWRGGCWGLAEVAVGVGVEEGVTS